MWYKLNQRIYKKWMRKLKWIQIKPIKPINMNSKSWLKLSIKIRNMSKTVKYPKFDENEKKDGLDFWNTCTLRVILATY